MYELNKLQEYIAQHREYSQYFIITLNGNSSIKILNHGLHGGAVVKNPPANAGDMGLSPGPGRSHMPQSN